MAALLIFIATYVVLALGRFPGLRVDRTGAAIVGASLMVAAGVLGFDEALRAVDWATIVLLLGMMIVVANLRLSGFFRLVAAWVVRHAHGPRSLLAGVVLVAGVFSAFFVNDTMCLVLTPLVVEVTLALRRNPVPYLLAVATASNAGSVATITGNPQNMMIGSLSGIAYRDFAVALAPIAAVSMLLVFGVILAVFRDEFTDEQFEKESEVRVRVNRGLMWKSLAVAVGMVGFFFAGWPVAQVAIVAGASLLVTRRVKPEKVYHDIDWSLLAMFAGLFIVVAGVEKTSLEEDLFRVARASGLHRPAVLTAFSAALSNLVSNVPAVLVFRPVISKLPDPVLGWLTLAMSSTLAGNFTILGSVANLIVVQRSKGAAVIGFWTFFKVGAPLTLMSLAFGAAWLTFVR
ncbi:MAG: anion transporter [Bryobacterales bacterium]|nr:anion transporter [Bryobacterales bacterium]